MLAYVFWHWPRRGVAHAGYEELQLGFLAALEAEPPPGFGGCATYRLEAGAPWVAAEVGYEDWYLVEDFAALGVLNDWAVTGSRRPAHDAVAAEAGGGAGGLYGLAGGPAVLDARYAAWLHRPPETYEGTLWRRQLVLGPAPEYCLHTAEAPSGLESWPLARI